MNVLKRSLIYLLLLLICLCRPAFGQDSFYRRTFPLERVKLLDGPFKQACELNTRVLLAYDVDRLLAPYFKEAGLTPKGESFPNWLGLDGHVGGHYLSALAIHYAATGDTACKQRMEYMISELSKCQEHNGDGYVGGVPNGKEAWAEIRSGNTAIVWQFWVPWYNLHKTYAGLRDAWIYAGNETAKAMFLELCDWGVELIDHLDDQQMEAMLANEFGGMNEVYADAYGITGDRRYLEAAKRFSHREILDSMAAGIDDLDNKHANTQVPKAVGYQRVAELGGEPAYGEAAKFFWQTVAYNRSLALGGNSRREHFPSKDDAISYVYEREGPESCNTNNMLRLTAGLFRMDHEAEYMDFYERALYNHILSTQHPVHGGYVYFTPARPAHYRVYSAPNSAMWCCVGTGMENHGKYGEMIYGYTGDSLLVNLFIASELNWEEQGLRLIQDTRFPDEETSRMTVRVDKPMHLTVLVRYPRWVGAGKMQVNVGGRNYASGASPASYVAITREWHDGDVIEMAMPMEMAVEELPDVPDYVAIMRGPILLGARVGDHRLDGLIADDHRWAHVAHGPLVSLFEAPALIADRETLLKALRAMQPMVGKPMSYTVPKFLQRENDSSLVLEPFYRIHDSRYMMYWLAVTPERYAEIVAEKKAEEERRLALDRRTIDAVTPGEQQPEVDHAMKTHQSHTGRHRDASWRSARDGGYFQYELETKGRQGLVLMVRYWGAEPEGRTVDILIDGQRLGVEDITGERDEQRFRDVVYPIPNTLVKNKAYITVRFQSAAGRETGRVFHIRLMESK